jgi:nucleoside-diphosphate-sugar epimerase
MINAIALTGATSMIGIALIKQCILHHIKVYAIVRPASTRINRLPKSDLITIVESDLDKLATIQAADVSISGTDIFYHIGWAGTDKQGRYSSDRQLLNIEYTLEAVRLASRLGCTKFVGAGSQAEYGIASEYLNSTVPVNPINAYGIAKYAAGKLAQIDCDKYGIDFNWVRILSVCGVNDNKDTLLRSFIHNCKHNVSMPLSPCTHVWDYLYEDDAGRALLAIGEKGINRKVYCLGSGIGKPLKEYLEIIKNMMNNDYKIEYGKIPYDDKSVRYLCADIAELTQDTGWRPEVSFEEGIRCIIAET